MGASHAHPIDPKGRRRAKAGTGRGRKRTEMTPERTPYRSDRAVALVVLALLALVCAYMFSTDWFYKISRDGFALGTMPALGIAIMAVCLLFLVFGKSAATVEPEMAESDAFAFKCVGLLVLGCGVYFFATLHLGFLLSTPVAVCAASYAFGVRPLRHAIYAGIAITAVLYAIFTAIGVQLSKGVLPF